ncbi:MAG: T9SS type A sorting domain-containing protein [Rhodothermales bacterium]|nr:T9SS type A sorting domain-containing protein [Rhodothermales bacterium]
MRLSLFGLLITLAATPAVSQDYWRAANGPFGGTIVSGMTVTPEGYFAATVGGLFHSTDGGRTWDLDNDGIFAAGVDAREYLRTQDGSSLLATYGGGIYRRWPGTSTWQQTNSPDGWTKAITQATDGTLYGATIRGIIRSDDGGSTWMALQVDERSLNIRDVITQDGVLYVATSEGVYKSDDRGVSWDWASSGMTTFDVDMLFLTSTGDLYAGTSPITGGCTLFRTRNAGRIWTCAQPQTDPIRAGGMAEDDLGRLYFGGYRFVYRSDDEGSTWDPIATTTTTIHGIAALGSTVVAGTYGRGVMRSGDRGTRWETSNEGLHSAIRDIAVGPDNGLYAATLGGVYVSHDLGNSWELLDDLDSPVRPSQSLAFDAQGRLLDGTLNGLFRLDLTADIWEALGPPGTPPVRDVLPGENGEIFVGYHAGVYHLRGNNWTSYLLIGPDQAPRDVIAIGVDEAGTLYAGGTYDSFMRPSGTNGWIRLTSMATPYFEAQVFEQDTDGTQYAGTRYFGVMRSTDGGQTWTPMTNGLSGSEDIRTIAFDASNTMHIGSFGNGVYRMNRNRWEPLDSGMEEARRVTALAFDAAGNAYAGTYGAGVWIHEATSTAVDPVEVVAETSLSIYPNPGAGAVSADVTVGASGDATLEIHDMMGRKVASGRHFLTSGRTTGLDLPVAGLAPGVYAVRLTTGSSTQTSLLTLVR